MLSTHPTCLKLICILPTSQQDLLFIFPLCKQEALPTTSSRTCFLAPFIRKQKSFTSNFQGSEHTPKLSRERGGAGEVVQGGGFWKLTFKCSWGRWMDPQNSTYLRLRSMLEDGGEGREVWRRSRRLN